jgi:hypothetical protein
MRKAPSSHLLDRPSGYLELYTTIARQVIHRKGAEPFGATLQLLLPHLRHVRAYDEQSCPSPYAQLRLLVCWCLHGVAGSSLGFSVLASTLHSFHLGLWLEGPRSIYCAMTDRSVAKSVRYAF